MPGRLPLTTRAVAPAAWPVAAAAVLAMAMAMAMAGPALAGPVAMVAAGPARSSRAAGPRPSASRPVLAWHGCAATFECATLTVPLDRDVRGGPTIALAVTRRRARDASRRIGSLVFNPGGPGEPGVAFLQGVADGLPGALRDRFDLVSFDPRGVGRSSPVVCEHSLDPLFDQAFSPADGAQRDALVAAARAVAQDCARRNLELLAHVSSRETAADLDALRAALGDRQLSFVGSSYGTYLGALYASAYPHRVRAMVLDGPVDPTLDAADATLAQARGFERALDDFLGDCSAHDTCPFHHGGDAAGAYDGLRARAATRPIAAAREPGRRLDETRLDAAVLLELYGGTASWPALGRALQSADDGDASSLLELADQYEGRAADGTDDHSLDAFWAVSCLDGPPVGDLAAEAALEARAAAAAPRLGAFIVNNSLPCSVWPVPALAPPGPLTAAGAPPILVVATTADPATPLAQGRALAGMLEHASLLVVRGEQHTAFDTGNRCVDDAVTHYLVARSLPSPGRRC